jgi:uncharacterized membrane protein
MTSWALSGPHVVERVVALVLAVASTAAMLYIGLYQSRVVEGLWCPLLGKGCEIVADAPFARPHSIPDGYIGAAVYGVILLLLLVPPGQRWAWLTLLVLGVLATYANIKGVVDMAKLGAFCTYCVFSTVASPVLLSMIWRLR